MYYTQYICSRLPSARPAEMTNTMSTQVGPRCGLLTAAAVGALACWISCFPGKKHAVDRLCLNDACHVVAQHCRQARNSTNCCVVFTAVCTFGGVLASTAHVMLSQQGGAGDHWHQLCGCGNTVKRSHKWLASAATASGSHMQVVPCGCSPLDCAMRQQHVVHGRTPCGQWGGFAGPGVGLGKTCAACCA